MPLRTSIDDFDIDRLCIHKAAWNLTLPTLALLLHMNFRSAYILWLKLHVFLYAFPKKATLLRQH